jgi:uncharacterized glyoxalase superfamily metalloenzyme YdcJ
LYDDCLATAEKMRTADPDLVRRDYDGYRKAYAKCFAPFPKTLASLLEAGLVYARYAVTAKARSAHGTGAIQTTNLAELGRLGFVRAEGLRYEDFLPFSAAGIFASNLGQYGTKSTAKEKPTYSRATLEEIMGRKIIDPDVTYHGLQAESVLKTYAELGLTSKLPPAERQALELAVAAFKSQAGD